MPRQPFSRAAPTQGHLFWPGPQKRLGVDMNREAWKWGGDDPTPMVSLLRSLRVFGWACHGVSPAGRRFHPML